MPTLPSPLLHSEGRRLAAARPLRALHATLGLVAALALYASSSLAAELPAKPKLQGTWKWTFIMPDGTKSQPRARIKFDGNLLTGTSLIGPGTEVPISDGHVDGDRVSWLVVREHAGRKVTTRYSGRLTEGLLNGTIESDWTGEKATYPWEARRASDSPTGTWRWEVNFGRGPGGGRPGTGNAAGAGATGAGTTANSSASQGPAPGGRSGGGGAGRGGGFRSEVVLKLEGDKLTGKMKGRSGDTEITNATFKDGNISFEVERERFGTVTVTKYWGVLDGDSIQGKSEFEFNEELRTVDWVPTRVEE